MGGNLDVQRVVQLDLDGGLVWAWKLLIIRSDFRSDEAGEPSVEMMNVEIDKTFQGGREARY